MSLRLYPIMPVDNSRVAGIKVITKPDDNDTQALTYNPSKNAMTWSDVAGIQGVRGPTGATGPAQPVASFCVRGRYEGGVYVMSNPTQDWSLGGHDTDGLLAPFVYHQYTEIPMVNKLVDNQDLLFIAPIDGVYNLSVTCGKLPANGVVGRVLVEIEIIDAANPNTKYSTEIIDFDNTNTNITNLNVGSWSQTLRLKTGTTVRPYLNHNYLLNGPQYITFSGCLVARIR